MNNLVAFVHNEQEGPLILSFLILRGNNFYKWGNILEYTKHVSTLKLSSLVPNVCSTIFILTLLRRH